MERRILFSIILAVVIVLLFVSFSINYLEHFSEMGYRIYLSISNTLIISDSDILSYNWTSQEITLTAESSERMKKIDDLYNFTGFIIKVDGEEIYHGVFRSPIMSAVPPPPSICIMFPSYTGNYRIMRMFFPLFQVPSDYPEKNLKILQHFEKVGKLIY